ncbi:hypothetical protein [Pseudochryseolinea flava]|uniref:DUF4062 domain-containing protein n=1 Tax=Pseudochryseolinea flava TaxID=2059302 RepID=A0A364Y3N1_9BACT|nr:hypothetical protein [Pseudochryseolinea flava]RAW01560.1 hypothetical protein DQQ10_07835 [Pseudochryseolinea flava]
MATRTIRVVIVSPSDVSRERELLLNNLETKFRRDLFEEISDARIIVEGWESIPPQAGYGQDVINKLLIEQADIVVAVFKHKLGTPTKDQISGAERAPSGTAEEVLYSLEMSQRRKMVVMVYYCSFPPDLSDVPKNAEWLRLEEFKKSIKDRVLYKLYDDEKFFLDIVCKDICKNIRHTWPKNP